MALSSAKKFISRLTAEVISCPVASVLYSKGKEEGRRKKEEGRSFKKRKNFISCPVGSVLYSK
ncbi:hypothetical protein [Okeania sp. SIO1I7]|uniref:hypothetical protein n=1 Tax=Okeania sp. SIO1I7 TaxID=2607772 RepID=UPI0013F853B2|nr:hypothetical protein [Okeania sp. SIO1I7]NET28336.1 hypothetical protein [Okeania sp. SIO1I7]